MKRILIGLIPFSNMKKACEYLNISSFDDLCDEFVITERPSMVKVEIPNEGLVVYYKNKSGDCSWYAIATNGEKVANGGEGYKHHTGAVKGNTAAMNILQNANCVIIY